MTNKRPAGQRVPHVLRLLTGGIPPVAHSTGHQTCHLGGIANGAKINTILGPFEEEAG
jgi:hypothetical protein